MSGKLETVKLGSNKPVQQNEPKTERLSNKLEWTKPGDYFKKFSLYKEVPSGPTSSNTLAKVINNNER